MRARTHTFVHTQFLMNEAAANQSRQSKTTKTDNDDNDSIHQ